MAEEKTVGGATIKRRHPWGTFGLTIITLGVYFFFWYYSVNKELRDYKPAAVEVKPGLSVLALFFTPTAIVSYICTIIRVRHAQTGSGSKKKISIAIGILLGLIGLYSVYVQSNLNKAWDAAS